MTRVIDRRKALELRTLGKSYSQIKKELGISKSTLSEWLRMYPLTKEQIRLLRDVNETRIERYRQTMRIKKEQRLSSYYEEEKKLLLPLSKRELFIAGLFLYWGEGAKSTHHTVNINNTDPSVLQFALYWMRNALDIPKEKIQVYLHLYSDMIVDDEIEFWSKVLAMPKNQFTKPYIKLSTRTSLDQKGYGHGTCGLRAHNTILKQRILMGIKAMADYSEGKIKEF